ncbi:hypothetical protein FOZ62_028022, partial [Perkinsus olseni]
TKWNGIQADKSNHHSYVFRATSTNAIESLCCDILWEWAFSGPEYGGESWAETSIRLVDEKYIQYLRSCSATLERSKAPTKVAKTKAQQASAPSSDEVFIVCQ